MGVPPGASPLGFKKEGRSGGMSGSQELLWALRKSCLELGCQEACTFLQLHAACI